MKLRLLLELEKGSSWKETRLYATYLGWYKAARVLKDKGIIEEKGVDNKGRKIWGLTDRGRKIVELLKEIRDLIGEDVDVEIKSK
jgi:DNA-binding PadR family transcriptional regulator